MQWGRTMSNETEMSMKKQYCTFCIDEHIFGVDVSYVQEVLRKQAISKVPLASNAINGLINLRGQIITSLNFRQRFGMSANDEVISPMTVVLLTDGGTVSVVVDKVGDVIEVETKDLEPTPPHLDSRVRSIVENVYWHEGRFLLFIDVNKTVATEENLQFQGRKVF